MRTQRWIILDSNLGYAEKLQDYLILQTGRSVEIAVFSELDDFFMYAKGKDITVIITVANFVESVRQFFRPGILVCLKREGEKEEGADIYLSRYGGMENIRDCIWEACIQRGIPTEFACREKRLGSQILILFTPEWELPQTMYAYQLAEDLAKKHRVLFFSTDSYASGIPKTENSIGTRSLTDYLYLWEMNPKLFQSEWEKGLGRTGLLQVVAGAGNLEELLEIPGESWVGFLKNIKEAEHYHYIVVDCKVAIRGLWGFLDLADVVISLKREGTEQTNRCQRIWWNELEKSGWSNLLEKRKEVLLPKEGHRIYALLHEEESDELARKTRIL